MLHPLSIATVLSFGKQNYTYDRRSTDVLSDPDFRDIITKKVSEFKIKCFEHSYDIIVGDYKFNIKNLDPIIIGEYLRDSGLWYDEEIKIICSDDCEYIYVVKGFMKNILELHNFHNPSVIGIDYEKWYISGKLSRHGGPAVIYPDREEYWCDGKKHNDYGPAVQEGFREVFGRGTARRQEWWIHDVLHRENGPAIIDGCREEWWKDGKRHRENGPAIIDGRRREWWNNGKLSRKNGPAIIDGEREEWWHDGKRHRKNGPAIVDKNLEEWWQNGLRHCEDGPAIVGKTEEWWRYGKKICMQCMDKKNRWKEHKNCDRRKSGYGEIVL